MDAPVVPLRHDGVEGVPVAVPVALGARQGTRNAPALEVPHRLGHGEAEQPEASPTEESIENQVAKLPRLINVLAEHIMYRSTKMQMCREAM